MQTVQATALALPSSFVASVQADGVFQVDVARWRVAHQTDEAESLLKTFIALVRHDLGLLCFVEALLVNSVRQPSELIAHGRAIVEHANDAAGFDVLSELAPLATPHRSASTEFDPERWREVFTQSISAKVHRTPIGVFTQLADDAGFLSLGHDARMLFDRLEATLRRLDSTWNSRLNQAGRLFVGGKFEPAEGARLLGISPSHLAAEFERLGFVRSLDTIGLSDAERARRLELMAANSGKPPAEELVERDVVASQRIEGIDAR